MGIPKANDARRELTLPSKPEIILPNEYLHLQNIDLEGP